MRHQLISITVVTIIMYLFGSVCAGTPNIGEWDNVGRVVLALVWLFLISNIETENGK